MTLILTNDTQNQNIIKPNILENEEEEDYVILPIIKFQEMYDYEIDSTPIKSQYISELPGSNPTNFEILELLTTTGIKENLRNHYWKKPYGYYKMTIQGLYYTLLWSKVGFNLDGLEILGGTP
ncbi:hypothetical protein O181_105872 [Austropuccinia psidii MF-1]|uniref:Uncharacterized protein n=1 Tax=Austropuccinia psidii MF-1 TaxID=1389203 RepID=A0A9Q3JPB9_9BASI|nr:hypothetical protein [Austropuccinia psidii MF-1]